MIYLQGPFVDSGSISGFLPDQDPDLGDPKGPDPDPQDSFSERSQLLRVF